MSESQDSANDNEACSPRAIPLFPHGMLTLYTPNHPPPPFGPPGRRGRGRLSHSILPRQYSLPRPAPPIRGIPVGRPYFGPGRVRHFSSVRPAYSALFHHPDQLPVFSSHSLKWIPEEIQSQNAPETVPDRTSPGVPFPGVSQKTARGRAWWPRAAQKHSERKTARGRLWRPRLAPKQKEKTTRSASFWRPWLTPGHDRAPTLPRTPTPEADSPVPPVEVREPTRPPAQLSPVPPSSPETDITVVAEFPPVGRKIPMHMVAIIRRFRNMRRRFLREESQETDYSGSFDFLSYDDNDAINME